MVTKSIAYTTYHALKKQRDQRDARRNELLTPEPRNLSAIARQPVVATGVSNEKTDIIVEKPATLGKPVKVAPKAEEDRDYVNRLEKQINAQKATIKDQQLLIKSLQKLNVSNACKFCGERYSSRNPRVRFRTCGHYFCQTCAGRHFDKKTDSWECPTCSQRKSFEEVFEVQRSKTFAK